jgi:hypothetical protein
MWVMDLDLETPKNEVNCVLYYIITNISKDLHMRSGSFYIGIAGLLTERQKHQLVSHTRSSEMNCYNNNKKKKKRTT